MAEQPIDNTPSAPATPSTPIAPTTHKQSLGAFDVRVFIATALGLIGIFLVICSFTADQSLEKTGGVNANLWTGLALVVVALVFVVWARFKPMYEDVPDTQS
ncbi:MAG: hypothetical protein LBR21_02430 [Propionibacteriaceae bacterium]|jgi:xanthine/uracil/vitamin C permease (AzgA family)|nr:hypothetical protein [Propionibacteriaceae bacterium]